MGAAHMGVAQCCCRDDGNGQRFDEDLFIQVSSDPVFSEKGTQTMSTISEPDSPVSPQNTKIDMLKKAGLFAADVSRTCKQQMEKAWVVLKGEIVAQKLIWISVPHRSDEEKNTAQQYMNDLDLVMELSGINMHKASLLLEGILIKHKAVLNKEILQAGERIKHLSSLTECRTELTNILLARAGKGKKSKALKYEDIESIISKAELCDKRLAVDIKKLLTVMDCPSDDPSETRSPSANSFSTASTGLSDSS
eukprot:TRINITY_DN2231_c0_g2_i1.p1 TRINITY_DN2231_c0_g2~~TRINITY_DN2231_c0_g2_i1.p1  ORF type:complete len:251 (-),score=50.98 TRINITY_DN2231_c0_g2_i1:243-995(-)